MHKNLGKVFVDLSDKSYPTYAVGKTGFIYLFNWLNPSEKIGDFIPYDSAFNGPGFFDNKDFIECHVDW